MFLVAMWSVALFVGSKLLLVIVSIQCPCLRKNWVKIPDATRH